MDGKRFTNVCKIELAATTAELETRKSALTPWRRAAPTIEVEPDDSCVVSEAKGVVTLRNGSARILMPPASAIQLALRDGAKAKGQALVSSLSCQDGCTIDELQLGAAPASTQGSRLWRSAGLSLLVIFSFALLVLVVGASFGVRVPDALIAGSAGGLVFRGRSHLNILVSLLVFAIVALGTEAAHTVVRSVDAGEASAMFATLSSVARPLLTFAGGLIGGFAARGLAEKFMPDPTW